MEKHLLLNKLKEIDPSIRTNVEIGNFKYDVLLINKLLINFNEAKDHNFDFKDSPLVGNKKYHINSSNNALENGYECIQWYEHYDTDKMLDFISSKVKPNKTIGARNCEIKVIDSKTAKDFIDKNHLLGLNKKQLLNIALFNNEELISCMSFDVLKDTKTNKELTGLDSLKDCWELTRFCTLKGCSIIGGASKLFNEFLNLKDPECVLTYSDFDLGNGSVYNSLGFKLLRKPRPTPFWTRVDSNGYCDSTLYLNDNTIRRGTDRILPRLVGKENYFKLGIDYGEYIERGGKEVFSEWHSKNGNEYGVWPNNIDNMLHYGFCRIFSSGSRLWFWKKNYTITDSELNPNIFDFKESNLYIGTFHEDKLSSYISLEILEKNKHMAQWKITDYKFTTKVEAVSIWNYFIKKFNVKSCLCKNEVNIFKGFGFKEIDGDWIYFPYGIVYKITDLDIGKFYIGETTVPNQFESGTYNGSGAKWLEHYEKYKNKHKFKREILKDDFKTASELYKYELEEIYKYCELLPNGNYTVDKSSGCMNNKTVIQSEIPVCPECGGTLFRHFKTCSRFTNNPCPECGSVTMHKKSCSKYNGKIKCEECGGEGSHKKSCSKYHTTICFECNGLHGQHKSYCSHYKQKEACPECGSIGVNHKKSCSQYKEQENCPECGGIDNKHRKTCSYYKSQTCSECGGLDGKHKDSCSKSRGTCIHCGYSLQSHQHAKDCPLYKKRKDPTPCKFCGSLTIHKKDCPKYIDPGKCPECGYSLRSHKHAPTCSKYKEIKKCEECGSRGGHKKFCPHYKHKEPCLECGVSKGPHKLWCSKSKGVKICGECNGKNGKHYINCSQYKPKPVCSECNGKNGHHYKSCPKYNK